MSPDREHVVAGAWTFFFGLVALGFAWLMGLAWSCHLGETTATYWAGEIRGPARVVDGDTLNMSGDRVRLWGVDAPELRQQCQSPEGPIPCGVVSRDHLERLIAGRDVECEVRDRDRYGRLVAVCEVPGAVMILPDLDLGEAMVEEGMALAYRKYSTDYVDEEDSARMDRRGLWAYEFEAPEDYRRGSR